MGELITFLLKHWRLSGLERSREAWGLGKVSALLSEGFREEEEEVYIYRAELSSVKPRWTLWRDPMYPASLAFSTWASKKQTNKKKRRESWLCTTVWICCAFIFSVYPQTFWPKGGLCGSGCGSGWQYRLNQIKSLWPRAWPWYWVCGWKSFIRGNA